MEDHRNNHAVERRLKDALRFDRARIQVGRISLFGLLELSRQRLRPSITETSTMPCPHCNGTGLIRSTESAALHVLRAIEEEGIRRRSREIVVHVATGVALYVLNQKRARLAEIEQRYGLSVMVSADPSLVPPDYRLERVRSAAAGEIAPPVRAESVLPAMGEELAEELEEIESDGETDVEAAEEAGGPAERPDRAPERREFAGEGPEEGDGGRRRRRRRGRHRRRDGEDREPMPRERGETGPRPRPGFALQDRPAPLIDGTGEQPVVEGPVDLEEHVDPGASPHGRERAERPGAEEGASGEPRPRRRRGRRGGRRRGRREQGQEGAYDQGVQADDGLHPGRQDQPPGVAAPGGDVPAWPRDPADLEQQRVLEPAPTRDAPWPLSPDDHPPAPPPAAPESERIEPVAAAPALPEPSPARETPTREPRASVPANVVVVDETTPKPAAARRGWWQRLTQNGN
jgi:ribonuclease E